MSWFKKGTLEPVAKVDQTPWMTWLISHTGEKEVSGSKANPFIVKTFDHTTYDTNSDETPWCAAGLCAALEESGYKSTKSAAASSYRTYGTPCEYKYGAILSIRHANGSNHVTCFEKWVDEKNKIAACRGCNQGNSIRVSNYDLSGNKKGHDEVVTSPRWPIKT